MHENNLPFALEFPVHVGNVSVSFFLYENLYLKGEACAAFPHDHSDYELLYTACGSGVQEIEGTAYPYAAGDLLLIRPGEYHHQSSHTLKQSTARYSIRFLLCRPYDSASSEEKRGFTAIQDILGSLRCLRDENGVLAVIFDRLHREFSQKRNGYLGCVEAECLLLFTAMLRLTGKDISAIFPSEELRRGNFFRSQIERFLHHRSAERVTLEDLALALRVSQRQASRLVRQAFGMSFVEKLTRVRIEKAKFLLVETEKSPDEIAADCGFQSYSYFSLCFRKKTGVPPSVYQKQHKCKS